LEHLKRHKAVPTVTPKVSGLEESVDRQLEDWRRAVTGEWWHSFETRSGVSHVLWGTWGRAFEERSCGITGCGRWPKRLGRGRESVGNVGRGEAID